MSDKNNVKIENLSQSQVKINITVPAGQFEKFVSQAAQELSNGLKIDGFRSGKIPREIIEKNVGTEKLLYEGAEKAIKKTYVDAILDKKVEAIGQPKIEIIKIAKGNDFEFSATVAVMPEVEMADWKDDVLKINKEFKSKKIQAKDSEIQEELDFLAKQRAKIITVDREAKKGDQVEVDFEALVNAVPIEGGTAKKHPVVIGEGKFIPGFEEQLIGEKAGQEKQFDLEFPRQYHQKTLAGKKATFKVKIGLVQERQIPEINDELARGIGKFKSLRELKENLKKGIEHEQLHKQEDRHKREIIDQISQKAKVEIPKVLVDNEVEKMFNELGHNVAMMGLKKEDYLKQLGTSEHALREQWSKKEAPQRVKAALALRKIAKQEEVAVDSKEIEERMNQILQYQKNVSDARENIDMERLYEAVKGELVNEKVFEILMGQKSHKC